MLNRIVVSADVVSVGWRCRLDVGGRLVAVTGRGRPRQTDYVAYEGIDVDERVYLDIPRGVARLATKCEIERHEKEYTALASALSCHNSELHKLMENVP